MGVQLSSTENERVWAETQASPEFQELKRKFRGFAFPLTAAFLVWYFLYERHSSKNLDGRSEALRDKVDRELAK
jgi:hypothetical protein